MKRDFVVTSYADAYNNEDPACPDETGLTWGYWNGYDWADAGAGLAIRCASSSGSGKQKVMTIYENIFALVSMTFGTNVGEY